MATVTVTISGSVLIAVGVTAVVVAGVVIDRHLERMNNCERQNNDKEMSINANNRRGKSVSGS